MHERLDSHESHPDRFPVAFAETKIWEMLMTQKMGSSRETRRGIGRSQRSDAWSGVQGFGIGTVSLVTRPGFAPFAACALPPGTDTPTPPPRY
jgi:hypothetical protein